MVSYKNARMVLTELNNAGCKMIGAVLNKCTKKTESHYGYGYTSNYNSRYGYSNGYGTGYTRGFAMARPPIIKLKSILGTKNKK